MPTTPMCQSNCPSTITQSVAGLNLAYRADGLGRDAALDLLAFLVARVEALRERFGLGDVAREEQVQRLLGVFEPAGRIEARADLKAHFVAADLSADARDFFNASRPGRRVAFNRSSPA